MRMTENEEEKTPPVPPNPPWAAATIEDVFATDFEAPIVEATTGVSRELCDLYTRARIEAEALGEPAHGSARVFSMLDAVLGMRCTREKPSKPFSPMLIWMDGRRSADMGDFRGPPLAALVQMAETASNPTLRARLCDVCWILDRRKAALGRRAVDGYIEIIERLEGGAFKNRTDIEVGALSSEGEEALWRALQIGRALGWEKDEALRARAWMVKLRERAVQAGHLGTANRYASLDLAMGVSKPAIIAAEIEQRVSSISAPQAGTLGLWRLAASAYREAGDQDSAHRCQTRAVDDLVAQGDQALEQQRSPMVAAHWLEMAIAEMNGLPNVRERRTALRNRLADVQSHIPDEMSPFSVPLDLEPMIRNVEQQLEGNDLISTLFSLAASSDAPEPAKLRQDAAVAMKDAIASSLFGRTYLDGDGKTIHRTEAGDSGDDGAIAGQIAQHESIRRQVHAAGLIDPVRRNLNDRFFLDKVLFRSLLSYSPFVPSDLLETYSVGFVRFFQGDFISAVYILTPLLENSLRFVLKQSGHDVTRFDDASRTQQDRTISQLFEQMRPELNAIFGDTIVADIEHTFVKRPGPAIRHNLAHGLLGDGGALGPDAVYGCWLIYRLCMLPLLPHKDEIELPY